MAPIRMGDGTEVAPKGIAEVRKGDGTVLYSSEPAIPDSEDLHAHYDATTLSYTGGETVSTFSAGVAGPDLPAIGGPTYQTDVQNGNAVVRYDGTDDGHGPASLPGSESQPNHAFVAYRFQSAPNDDYGFVLGTERDTEAQDFFWNNNSGEDWWGSYAGTNLESSAAGDTSWHIAAILYNGSNSTLRLDGSQVASGDLGADAHTDIALAYLADSNRFWSNIDIGEVLWYSGDKSSRVGDIELYLNDKWAVY